MRTKVIITLLLLSAAMLVVNCKKDKDEPQSQTPGDPNAYPKVLTSPVINIADSTATSGGTITAEGHSSVVMSGVCWDTISQPSISDSHTEEGPSAGVFISHISGLKSNKTYYIRAYATNSSGTAYGNQITFSTKPVYWKKGISTSVPYINSMLSSGSNIYAATEDGVLFSADTGNTWVSKGLTGYGVKKIVRNSNALFAVVWQPNNSIFKSTDNGTTWNSITANFPYALGLFDVAGLGNDNLFAGSDSSAWISEDNGDSWQKKADGLPNPAVYLGFAGLIYTMASTQQHVYAITSAWDVNTQSFRTTLFQYNENSSSWGYGLQIPQFQYNYGIATTNSKVFFYTGTGLIVSENGQNWSPVSAVTETNLQLSSHDTKLFFVNPAGTFYLSQDNGESWSVVQKLGLSASGLDKPIITTHYLWIRTGDGVYKYKYN
jgi:hypothetical protein